MLDIIRRRVEAHPKWSLALITVCVLLPFLGKPFNIDDPLFIWIARQIHVHPADPYGFNVEWGWHAFPMYDVTENPPLVCYYVALAAGVVGWSEIALHFAFLLAPLAVILGTYRLARRFCTSPMTAALATLFTPALLASSTTVMCDVPMLAFWIWAVAFWIEGLEENDFGKLFGAACLVALAQLSKYFGVCLVPLLAAYGILMKRRASWSMSFLLIPIIVFCLYQMVMHRRYDLYPLFGAIDYSLARENTPFAFGSSCLIGLGFTGGCMAVVLFFAPLLWRKRGASISAFAAFAGCAFVLARAYLEKYRFLQGHLRVSAEIQLALWAAAGVLALALAAEDLLARRDAKSLLLALWVGGTFVFAAYLNWSINARSVLPMAPAIGILIARRLERNFPGPSFPVSRVGLCLATSAAFSLVIAEADCLTALAIRQNARAVGATYAKTRQLWFQGHWGFQFYMQQFGARPLDFKNDSLKPGDLVAIPSNNTNLLPPGPGKADLLEIYSEPGPPALATLSETLGASFYSSALGPLPFAFGPVPPEIVSIYSLR